MFRSKLKTNSNMETPVCRICLCNEKLNPKDEKKYDELINPCKCSGTMGLIHRSCLDQWRNTNDSDTCEICKFEFIFVKRYKQFIEYVEDRGYKLDQDDGVTEHVFKVFIGLSIMYSVFITIIIGCIIGFVTTITFYYDPHAAYRMDPTACFFVCWFYGWLAGMCGTGVVYSYDMFHNYIYAIHYHNYRIDTKTIVVKNFLTPKQRLEVNLGRRYRHTICSSITRFLVLFSQWLWQKSCLKFKRVFCCCCLSKEEIEKNSIPKQKRIRPLMMKRPQNRRDVINV